jgi:hypothetical protein
MWIDGEQLMDYMDKERKVPVDSVKFAWKEATSNLTGGYQELGFRDARLAESDSGDGRLLRRHCDIHNSHRTGEIGLFGAGRSRRTARPHRSDSLSSRRFADPARKAGFCIWSPFGPVQACDSAKPDRNWTCGCNGKNGLPRLHLIGCSSFQPPARPSKVRWLSGPIVIHFRKCDYPPRSA